MTLEELFKDKTIKGKEQPGIIHKWLLDKTLNADELIHFAQKGKDPVKGACIEAFEYTTKENPAMATKDVYEFATLCLTEKAPRVKWEAAKVIGNVAHLFPKDLDTAIKNLLENTKHDGTVVRWAAAFALGEILKLKTPQNKELLPLLENVAAQEEKNSIKKIYLDAFKKAAK